MADNKSDTSATGIPPVDTALPIEERPLTKMD